MYGITSYATYIPWLRLTPDTDGWPHSFQRSVANFDEDAITMGVAAGKLCLHNSDFSKIKALLFCSTSAPYAEKQNAAVIAAALNLPSNVLTVDLAGSIRSSTSAIYLALDMIQANPEESVLIISSDTRMGMARSSLDDSFGDGAAAILLGQEDPVAIIESKSSQTSILYDL
jgi:3-hydroxy-3-methylglutaryl CoA synthase